MAEQKSFAPSKRKLEKARKEGRVLKSSLVSQWAVVTSSFLLIFASFGPIWVAFKMLLEYGVTSPDVKVDQAFFLGSSLLFRRVSQILVVTAVVAILAEIAQVGTKVVLKPLTFQFERLNPVTGVGRIFGNVHQAWEGLLRVFAVASLGVVILSNVLPILAGLQSSESSSIFEVVIALVREQVFWLLGLFGILALCDYFLRRRVFLRELSMSHEELREEHKEQDGSPLMKALRRALHERIVMQDVTQRVRRSKLIVVKKMQ